MIKLIRDALSVGLILTGIFHAPALASRWNSLRGSEVLTDIVVSSFGGVVLQGTTEFYDAEAQVIPPESLELQLQTHEDGSVGVFIISQETSYDIGISPEVAASLARWVLTKQTGAYTNALNDEIEDSERYLTSVVGGYAAFELAQGFIPEILYFLDFELILNNIEDVSLKEIYNSRIERTYPSVNLERYKSLTWEEHDSYINTDIDTDFSTVLIDGKAQSDGLIYRYYWAGTETEFPYITGVHKACSVESIKSYDVRECSDLYYSDYVYEPSGEIEVQQEDYIIFYLVTGTTADSIIGSPLTNLRSNSENIFFSLSSINAQRFRDFEWNINERDAHFSHALWSSESSDSLLLEWEDTIGGGDGDYNDLKVSATGISESDTRGVFKIDSQQEGFQLPKFRIRGKHAEYISEFGFIKVDDKNGSIDGIMPKDPEYIDIIRDRSRLNTVIDYEEMRDIHDWMEIVYPRQQDAILFAQSTAIFRRFADDNPQALEIFISNAAARN